MQMRAECNWVKKYTTIVHDGRGHSVVVDQPKNMGGYDLGTSSLELLLEALASCLVTMFVIFADKQKLPFTEVRATAVGEKGEKTFEKINAKLLVKSTAEKEAVEKVFKMTEDYCPVSEILRQTQIEFEVELI